MDDKVLGEFVELFERLGWEHKSPEEIDRDIQAVLALAVDIYLRPRVPPRPLRMPPPPQPPGLFGAWAVSKLSVQRSG